MTCEALPAVPAGPFRARAGRSASWSRSRPGRVAGWDVFLAGTRCGSIIGPVAAGRGKDEAMISEDDVRYVAKLARLRLEPDEARA